MDAKLILPYELAHGMICLLTNLMTLIIVILFQQDELKAKVLEFLMKPYQTDKVFNSIEIFVNQNTVFKIF